MNVETANALATFGAAAVFVLIFYAESWWKPSFGGETTRRLVSFSVGMAVAYVFVHLLPELATTTAEFVELDEARELPFPHLRIYVAALLGFMLFYGLENMVNWARVAQAEGGEERGEELGETVHLKILTASYALYVFVVCYVMAHEIRSGSGELALYAFAMGLHFLGFAYGLRRDSSSDVPTLGPARARSGRPARLGHRLVVAAPRIPSPTRCSASSPACSSWIPSPRSSRDKPKGDSSPFSRAASFTRSSCCSSRLEHRASPRHPTTFGTRGPESP